MQKITPFLWFDKEAAAAAKFYTSVFKDAKIINSTTLENTPSGTVEIVTIELSGQQYQLMSAGPLFKFNEAISFVVNCENQEEIDYYWAKLSADPNAESAAGSRINSACHGRSCRRSCMRCKKPRTRKSWRASPRRF